MAVKELVIKEKLEATGIFDFPGLYSTAHGWYKYEEYGLVEEEYTEKVGATREIVFKWKATKSMSDYFNMEHSLKFEIRGLSDVEVEIDGKKKKMNKGTVVIEIKGTMVQDPDSSWETSPWNKFLRETYNKFIIPGRTQSVKDKIVGDVQSFKADMKSYLELSGKK